MSSIRGLFHRPVIRETPPPASFAGREAVRLHVSEPWRLVVVSKPSGGSTGSYALHHVDLDATTGFRWGQEFLDAGYPGDREFQIRSPPRANLMMASGGFPVTRIRVYQSGYPPLRFVGEIQTPNPTEVWFVDPSSHHRLAVMEENGYVSIYDHVTLPDGTSALQLSHRSQPSAMRSIGIRSGAMFSPSSALLGVSSGGFGVVWFHDGAVYGAGGGFQDSHPPMGPEVHQLSWYAGQPGVFAAPARLVLTRVSSMLLRAYYYPGSGNTWHRLKYLSQQGTLADYYRLDARWDVENFRSFTSFDGTGPIWVVTCATSSRRVTVLRMALDLANGHYRLHEVLARDANAVDVAWYRGDSEARTHIELLADGTLRLVRRRRFGFL